MTEASGEGDEDPGLQVVGLRGHEPGHKSSSASSPFKAEGSTQELIHMSDEQTGNDIIV